MKKLLFSIILLSININSLFAGDCNKLLNSVMQVTEDIQTLSSKMRVVIDPSDPDSHVTIVPSLSSRVCREDYCTDFLKISREFIIPGLKNNTDPVLFTLLAAGSVGKSTLFNALPYIIQRSFNKKGIMGKVVNPIDKMSPVGSSAGLTQSNIYIHKKGENALAYDPPVDSRFSNSEGDSTLNWLIENPDIQNEKRYFNPTVKGGEDFHITNDAIPFGVGVVDTPGFDNGIEALKRSRKAYLRSEIFMIYVNETNYNSDGVVNTIREIMDDYGQRKLVLVYRLPGGYNQVDVEDERMTHLKQLVASIYGGKDDNKPIEEIFNNYKNEIMGIYFVPYSKALVFKNSDLDNIRGGKSLPHIDSESELVIPVDEIEHVEIDTHPRMVKSDTSLEFSDLIEQASLNRNKIKDSVVHKAIDNFTVKGELLVHDTQIVKAETELYLEVLRSEIASKVSKAFEEFPYKSIETEMIAAWEERHSVVVNSVESASKWFVSPVNSAKRLFGKKKVRDQFEGEIEDITRNIVNSISNIKLASKDEFHIYFSDSGTLEKVSDSSEFKILVPDYLLDKKNLELNSHMIRLHGNRRSASNADEAYSMINQNNENTPVVIKANNSVRKILKEIDESVSDEYLRHDVNLAVRKIFSVISLEGQKVVTRGGKDTSKGDEIRKYIREVVKRKSDGLEQLGREIRLLEEKRRNKLKEISQEYKVNRKNKMNKKAAKVISAAAKERANNYYDNDVAKKAVSMVFLKQKNLTPDQRDELEKAIRTNLYKVNNSMSGKLKRGLRMNTSATMSGASVATAVALAIEFASPIPIPGLISGIVTSITGVGSSQIHSKIAAKNNYAELQDILNNWYRGQQSMLVDSIFEEMYIKPLEEKVAGIKGINFTEVKKALRTIRVELEVNRSIDEGIPHI